MTEAAVLPEVAASLEEARRLGIKKYHGKPCKGCESTIKWTLKGYCVDCSKERSKNWRDYNVEKICINCHKKYVATKRDGRFCSRECVSIYKAIEKLSSLSFPQITKIYNLRLLKEGKEDHRRIYVDILCKCGLTKTVNLRSLLTKNTISCGCIRFKHSTEIVSLTYLSCIKAGANSRRLIFDITIQNIQDKFIEQDGRCILTGVKIRFYKQTNKRKDYTASIDRINSSLGYFQNNIQLIHKDTQRIKWDYDDEYIRTLCKTIFTINNYTKTDLISNHLLRRFTTQSKNKTKYEFHLDGNMVATIYNNQYGKCVYSGIELGLSVIKEKDWKVMGTLSIDRIDSALPYTINNSQLVHKDINYMKHTKKENEFLHWCYLIYAKAEGIEVPPEILVPFDELADELRNHALDKHMEIRKLRQLERENNVSTHPTI